MRATKGFRPIDLIDRMGFVKKTGVLQRIYLFKMFNNRAARKTSSIYLLRC